MQSTPARIGLLVVAVAVAVVAFVLLKNDSSDNDSDTAKSVQVLTVNNGEPVGGVKTLTYNVGDTVRFDVKLDQPEEKIHVHGYEIEQPAEHSPVTFSFPAKLDGEFEVEVHRLDGTEAPIAELHINP